MKYWRHHYRMIAKILSSSYSYGKLNVLMCYYKLLIRSILHHKIYSGKKNSNSNILTIDFLGFHIQFFSYPQLLNLFEEIFIFQVYKFSTSITSPCIIDCGSNIGLSVLYFKKILPTAKILAFEPGIQTFKILEENVKQNELTNISLFNFALSDAEGEIEFYKNSVSSGSLNMSIIKSSNVNTLEKVNSKKLSRSITEEIEMLKIDVEGAEFRILKDLIETNTINFVSNMIIEFHTHLSEISIHEFTAKIKACDFVCHMPEIKIFPNAKDVMLYCEKNPTRLHN